MSAHSFRNYFTPLPGYFSPFPHGTKYTIGHTEYLGLPGGPGRFTTDSTSPLLLGQPNNPHAIVFNYRTLTFSGRPFQTTSPNNNTQAR